VVDDRGEQARPVAEVVLDHPGAHAGPLDDVAGAGRGETLLPDAPDGLGDDEFAGAVGAFLAPDGIASRGGAAG